MATKKWIAENQDKLREYRRDWYYRNRKVSIERSAVRAKAIQEWFAGLKSKLSCGACGENHPATLDFHHPDSSEKEFSVSTLVSKGNKNRILDEIAKCDVLCANCHRKHHYNERLKK